MGSHELIVLDIATPIRHFASVPLTSATNPSSKFLLERACFGRHPWIGARNAL